MDYFDYLKKCNECYYVPSRRVVLDFIRPGTDRTVITNDDLAAVLAREPDAIRLTINEASERQNTSHSHGPRPTTAEQFDEMLGCVPPEWMKRTNGGFAFAVGERTCGTIGSVYVELDGAETGDDCTYWHLSCDVMTSKPADIMTQCRTARDAA